MLERVLSARTTYWALLLAHALMVMATLWATRGLVLGDAPSYIALADGILHGEYTQWWQLEEEVPDTWRTPGFPLYIAVFMWLSGGTKVLTAVQVLLYGLSIYLMLRVMDRFDRRLLVKNLFLLMLLPVVNVPYYIGQVYPEIPTLAAISAALFIITRPGAPGTVEAIALGLLHGFIFQCRPVFLLLPLVLFLVRLAADRGGFRWRGELLTLLVFGITLLPYALWNQRHHGRFKVTPLEGGGGMVHIGYWCGKMPGYQEHVYWHNFMGEEIVRFTPADSVAANIAAYEKEWVGVNAELAPFLTRTDSVMMASRRLHRWPFTYTYNTAYTLERERLLVDRTVMHVKADPGYYFAYKAWSALRLWVIGPQRDELLAASLMGKVKILSATIVTGVLFLLAVVLIPLAYRRRRLAFSRTWPLVVFMLYGWVIHIPFVIQTRYTVPIRFAMLALLALAIAQLWKGADRRPATRRAEGKGDANPRTHG